MNNERSIILCVFTNRRGYQTFRPLTSLWTYDLMPVLGKLIIDVFTVLCAILDNTPESNIQGRIKGIDALGLRLGGTNFVKL